MIVILLILTLVILGYTVIAIIKLVEDIKYYADVNHFGTNGTFRRDKVRDLNMEAFKLTAFVFLIITNIVVIVKCAMEGVDTSGFVLVGSILPFCISFYKFLEDYI